MVKWEGIRAIFHFSLSAKNTPSPYHKTKDSRNSLFHIYVCFCMYIYVYLFLGECLWILFGSLATRYIDMPHQARLLSLTFTLPLALYLFTLNVYKYQNASFAKSVSDCTLLHEITQLLIRWPFVVWSSLFHLDKSTATETMFTGKNPTKNQPDANHLLLHFSKYFQMDFRFSNKTSSFRIFPSFVHLVFSETQISIKHRKIVLIPIQRK